METSGLPLGVDGVIFGGCECDATFTSALSVNTFEGVVGKGESIYTCGISGYIISIDEGLLQECGSSFNVSKAADQLQAIRALGQELGHPLADLRQGTSLQDEIHRESPFH